MPLEAFADQFRTVWYALPFEALALNAMRACAKNANDPSLWEQFDLFLSRLQIGTLSETEQQRFIHLYQKNKENVFLQVIAYQHGLGEYKSPDKAALLLQHMAKKGTGWAKVLLITQNCTDIAKLELSELIELDAFSDKNLLAKFLLCKHLIATNPVNPVATFVNEAIFLSQQFPPRLSLQIQLQAYLKAGYKNKLIETAYKAIQLGEPTGLTALMSLYMKSASPDYIAAKECLELLGSIGCVRALCELSRFYQKGLGVEVDMAKAKQINEWAKKLYLARNPSPNQLYQYVDLEALKRIIYEKPALQKFIDWGINYLKSFHWYEPAIQYVASLLNLYQQILADNIPLRALLPQFSGVVEDKKEVLPQDPLKNKQKRLTFSKRC